MKKAIVVLVLAALSLAVSAVPTNAGDGQSNQWNGCWFSQGGCKDPVPEPNSFVLLASGIAALGGLAIAGRKRWIKN